MVASSVRIVNQNSQTSTLFFLFLKTHGSGGRRNVRRVHVRDELGKVYALFFVVRRFRFDLRCRFQEVAGLVRVPRTRPPRLPGGTRHLRLLLRRAQQRRSRGDNVANAAVQSSETFAKL